MRITLAQIGKYRAGKLASHSELEPLPLEYLGAVTEKAGHNTEIFQQRDEGLEEVLEKILQTNPGVVGISCYTYNFPEALNMAKKIKSKNSDIKTVLGGYHATGMPSDIKYDGFDFFVIGEGEETFLELISNLDNKKFDDLKGISYVENGEVKINPRRERLDFSKLPWPLRKKELLHDIRIRGVTEEKEIAQIAYSRGCPFKCDFCCSPEMWPGKVEYREPENVVAEMKELSKNYGVNFFFFADLTFNASTKRVLELTSLLKKEKFGWCCMPSFDSQNLDEKMIKEWAEAGCKRAMFGVESIDSETAQLLGKKGTFKERIRFDEIYRVFRLFDKYGVGSRAFLMFGNSNEKPEDIKNYLEQLKILLPDEIRISITTPLPGSDLYKKLDKSLLLHQNFPQDWEKFSTNQLIVKHKYFKEGEVEVLSNWLFDSYYQSEEYGRHLREKAKQHPHLREGIENFVYNFLSEKHNLKVYGF